MAGETVKRLIGRLGGGREGVSRAGLSVMALRVGAAGLAFIAQVLAARIVGAEAFGAYALILVWLLLLGHGATAGTNQLVCRFVSAYRATGETGAALGLLRFALALAMGVAVVVSMVAIGLARLGPFGLSPEMVTLATLAFSVVPLLVLQDFLEAIARGLDRPLLGIGPALVLRHLAIICGVLAVFATGTEADATTIMGFTVAGLFASVLVQYGLLHNRLRAAFKGAVPRYRIGYWLRTALPVALLDACEVLFNNADVLILGLFVAPETLAYYFAATRLAQILAYVPYGLSAATAQKYAALAAKGKRARLQALIRSATGLATALTVAGALGLALLGGPLLALFGAGFESAAPAVIVLSLGIVMVCALGPGEDILTMLGAERLCALGFALALIVNIALNFALIPVFGLMGAAAASAVALGVRGAVLAFFAYRRLGLVLPVGLNRLAGPPRRGTANHSRNNSQAQEIAA